MSDTTTIRSSTPVPVDPVALVVYFRQGATVHPLPAAGAVVVGRGKPADLMLDDPSLSRQHARFTHEGGKVWVEDLGSTNGTRINGKRVSRGRVKAGDAVWLGSVAVSLHAATSAEAELQGLLSYERFAELLEEEVTRAQTFGRPVGVVLLRAEGRATPRLDQWCPRVRAALRPVDRLALYSPTMLLVCLVESGSERTEELARHLVQAPSRKRPAMVAGWSVYPEHASSAEELVATVLAAARVASRRAPVAGAPTLAVPSPSPERPIVGSPGMREVFRLATQLAASPYPVLIQGETGVGKEIVARAVHEASPRKDRPLRSINCAAIPAALLESALFGHERGAFTGADQRTTGLFEEADGGSLLLDEIGELSPAAQAALLRVLDTKRFCRVGSAREIEVDVRLLAATNRDLEAMVQQGAFRADLLYRLNTVVIEVPPLRERIEEIVALAEHFVRRACKAARRAPLSLDRAAVEALLSHDWPGNVRELRNALERAVVLAVDKVITVEDLPDRVQTAARRAGAGDGAPVADIRGTLEQVEARLLVEALEANGWNQSRTAEAMGMPRRTLVYKLRRYGIRKKDAR